METKTFKVPNISCNHCVHAIKSEVGDLAGVSSVEVSKDSQLVTVTWDAPQNWEGIKSLLEEINYPPES